MPRVICNVDPSLHKYIPNFEYILVNVGKKSDDDIAQLVESGALQSSLLALKYIYDTGLNSLIIQILTPLKKAKLPMENLRPWLEAILSYLSGIKNRVPDEVLTESVRTVFAEEAEIMETIFDRLRERGRQEGIQATEEKYQRVLQREEREREREEREREREAFAQKGYTKQRNIILGILNHSLKPTEDDLSQITKHLEKIEDEEALDRLINDALDAAGRDFTYFLMRLIAEGNES
ncbi:MAG: hypothetical protein AAF639_47640 [Chloroflexota bacterium]